jgi:hypothetical protein
MIGDLSTSDPYCKLEVSTGIDDTKRILLTTQTEVKSNTLKPEWSHLVSLPVYLFSNELTFSFEVWDRDDLTADDFLGQFSITIPPYWQYFNQKITKPLSARLNQTEKLSIRGQISFSITYYLDDFSKIQLAYKKHNHKITGFARSISSGEEARAYGTYQITLYHVKDIFNLTERSHWNEKYEAAQKIFNSPVLKGTITTQHTHLYSDVSVTKKGFIKNGHDFLTFLKMGKKGGKPRFFTYAILENTWFFSETGAAFFVDFTSKHAMHACAQEYVYFAGEFVIIPTGEGKYKLCIDNNSGTYAPKEILLKKLRKLLELNFPGLEVETNDYHNEILKIYKNYVLTGEMQ